MIGGAYIKPNNDVGNMWMDSGTTVDMRVSKVYSLDHNGKGVRYLCLTCGKTYALQASLYNHKKFECGKAPNFICPHCPHQTKQKGNLKTHIRNKHPEKFSEEYFTNIDKYM